MGGTTLSIGVFQVLYKLRRGGRVSLLSSAVFTRSFCEFSQSNFYLVTRTIFSAENLSETQTKSDTKKVSCLTRNLLLCDTTSGFQFICLDSGI